MSVLAHGAYGPADELVLLVPVVVLFVLALVSLRRRNARAAEQEPGPPEA